MQLEVRRLQRKLGLTTIFITHDQEEALVLSDRIAVMNHGAIQQVATTTEIYERPANDFVADFVGESNIFHGTMTEAGTVVLDNGRTLKVASSRPAGRKVGVLMRPERFSPGGTNAFSGEVVEAVYLGTSFKLRIACEGGMRKRAPGSGVVCPVQPVEALGEVGLEILDVLQANVNAQDVLVLRPRHGGAVVVGMGGDHQALVAAPARAHAEDVHAVEHGGERVAAKAVAQGEGEQAG